MSDVTVAESTDGMILRLQGLTRRFHGFTAVDGVHFDLAKGVIGGLKRYSGMVQPS